MTVRNHNQNPSPDDGPRTHTSRDGNNTDMREQQDQHHENDGSTVGEEEPIGSSHLPSTDDDDDICDADYVPTNNESDEVENEEPENQGGTSNTMDEDDPNDVLTNNRSDEPGDEKDENEDGTSNTVDEDDSDEELTITLQEGKVGIDWSVKIPPNMFSNHDDDGDISAVRQLVISLDSAGVLHQPTIQREIPPAQGTRQRKLYEKEIARRQKLRVQLGGDAAQWTPAATRGLIKCMRLINEEPPANLLELKKTINRLKSEQYWSLTPLIPQSAVWEEYKVTFYEELQKAHDLATPKAAKQWYIDNVSIHHQAAYDVALDKSDEPEDEEDEIEDDEDDEDDEDESKEDLKITLHRGQPGHDWGVKIPPNVFSHRDTEQELSSVRQLVWSLRSAGILRQPTVQQEGPPAQDAKERKLHQKELAERQVYRQKLGGDEAQWSRAAARGLIKCMQLINEQPPATLFEQRKTISPLKSEHYRSLTPMIAQKAAWDKYKETFYKTLQKALGLATLEAAEEWYIDNVSIHHQRAYDVAHGSHCQKKRLSRQNVKTKKMKAQEKDTREKAEKLWSNQNRTASEASSQNAPAAATTKQKTKSSKRKTANKKSTKETPASAEPRRSFNTPTSANRAYRSSTRSTSGSRPHRPFYQQTMTSTMHRKQAPTGSHGTRPAAGLSLPIVDGDRTVQSPTAAAMSPPGTPTMNVAKRPTALQRTSPPKKTASSAARASAHGLHTTPTDITASPGNLEPGFSTSLLLDHNLEAMSLEFGLPVEELHSDDRKLAKELALQGKTYTTMSPARASAHGSHTTPTDSTASPGNLEPGFSTSLLLDHNLWAMSLEFGVPVEELHSDHRKLAEQLALQVKTYTQFKKGIVDIDN